MRHVVNFGLLFTFLALAVTGVMEFVLPFSLDTARVHIIAGVAMIVLVVLHVLGRLPYFRKQVTANKGTAFSRVKLLMVVAASAGLIAVASLGLPPSAWLMQQGYEARNSAQIVRSSSLVGFAQPSSHSKLIVRQSKDETARPLSLYLSFRREIENVPAVAVWAETSTGTMIETLYLDQELAFSDKLDWHGALVQRNHILPIWRNRYTAIAGVDADGNVDATTGATDTHSFALDKYLIPGKGNKFILCVELNVAADTNDAWHDPQLGQPSLLYTAYVKVDDEQRYSILELTAHGGGAEDNGNLQYDLDGFTTAKDLLDLALAKLENAGSVASSE